MMQYLLNGILLFIPVFIWNAVFFKRLPDFYQPENWDNIPKALDVSENILRYSSFVMPILFKLDFSTVSQRIGLVLYLAGLLIYFISWMVQIIYKDNKISAGLLFRAAPAYTTIIWMTGIGLIGKYSYIPNLQKFYFPVIAIFTIIHTSHSYIIWRRL